MFSALFKTVNLAASPSIYWQACSTDCFHIRWLFSQCDRWDLTSPGRQVCTSWCSQGVAWCRRWCQLAGQHWSHSVAHCCCCWCSGCLPGKCHASLNCTSSWWTLRLFISGFVDDMDVNVFSVVYYVSAKPVYGFANWNLMCEGKENRPKCKCLVKPRLIWTM